MIVLFSARFPAINVIGQMIFPLSVIAEISTVITDRIMDGNFAFNRTDSTHTNTEKQIIAKILSNTEITAVAAIVRDILQFEKIIRDCTGSPARESLYCERRKAIRTVSEKIPNSSPSVTDTIIFL